MPAANRPKLRLSAGLDCRRFPPRGALKGPAGSAIGQHPVATTKRAANAPATGGDDAGQPHRSRIEETHGILTRPENKIRASSDRFGWSSLYASAQREIPYEGYFPAVKDQLIVQHLDGPVPIDRLHGPNPARCVVPPAGSISSRAGSISASG